MLIFSLACNNSNNNTAAENQKLDSSASAESKIVNDSITLPMPDTTKSVSKRSTVIGWKENKMPMAPQGFQVSKFAENLQHPRWIYIAGNGDVFVSQADKDKSPNNILLFRDANNDGVPESQTVFLKNMNMPFGMLILGNKFYVANTDALLVYDYTPGAASITSAGKKIASYPGGPRHWTRNIIASKNGDKIYIGVGSSSNIGENGMDKEVNRACIIEVNRDGSGEKIYASGLRNPVGMDWAPGTNQLWTAVNERDELGDDVPPDYLTAVKEGGFYGWPYAYFGQHEDPRLKGQKPDLVQKTIKPDVILGPHTASLGLTFYTQNNFPEHYRGGAFIGQHGSWNRSKFSGYKVVFVPFSGGKPSGKPEDFLTGFIANEEKSEVYGRPVGVAVLNDGSLLVADDGGRIIWRVHYTGK
ncbi:L-sorbosone dehydrogenase [Flavisolibacter tropicus]|uniref:L-sorbosone dehydrogenase n=1 Tax=Flavisolibacter tropicus TaxID=1492898 RepID=A0A172U2N0_9BACT|nr:L-sorbosone dehydrogenase [Flavisolibacter tropicus]